jgi:hypothetical protein
VDADKLLRKASGDAGLLGRGVPESTELIRERLIQAEATLRDRVLKALHATIQDDAS